VYNTIYSGNDEHGKPTFTTVYSPNPISDFIGGVILFLLGMGAFYLIIFLLWVLWETLGLMREGSAWLFLVILMAVVFSLAYFIDRKFIREPKSDPRKLGITECGERNETIRKIETGPVEKPVKKVMEESEWQKLMEELRARNEGERVKRQDRQHLQDLVSLMMDQEKRKSEAENRETAGRRQDFRETYTLR
jgi:hypothetical protein